MLEKSQLPELYKSYIQKKAVSSMVPYLKRCGSVARDGIDRDKEIFKTYKAGSSNDVIS